MIDSRESSQTGTDAQAHVHHRRGRWMWWLFAAMALFYLLAEHRAHLFGVLPYLLVLACPLMHRFMHGHHGHRHDHVAEDKGDHHEQP
ncbi:MAG: DUF2933 domain-containing protein [Proteobacteria bacterium]|jgi:hypothetical protein|nr:DUF2933 domain-containing protein [Pseudomonadota bacterium]MBS0370595.1 DUF2933 domain-containing protein [Pseudomonadota bacterium]